MASLNPFVHPKDLRRRAQGEVLVHQIRRPHYWRSHGIPFAVRSALLQEWIYADDPILPKVHSPTMLPPLSRSWHTTELPCGVTGASSTMTPPALPLRWPRFFFHSGIARGYGTSSSPMKRRRGLSCQERCVVVGLVSGLGNFRWPRCRAAEAMLFGISYKIAMVFTGYCRHEVYMSMIVVLLLI
ncbi:uncharacterized protein LOC119268446 isoform X2 [Triticum dicoccoides]|uniref:uncharacterized protein LOC119268446 isoform X2 n=1 Tax=Triticum dicoccoides TaxID=85692 RepID=UPI00188F3685|nr:uncharacterized protein LOC119268446 isoform X2 [Triticum dicoccoides]XP_037405982.1 uncharacterized protein LOC119268446 isoform X2 [Triticum dicoccoides]